MTIKFFKVAPDKATLFSSPAAAGEYEPGTLVMLNPADGRVLPVTASATAGLAVAGMVTEGQTVAAGEELNYEKGFFAMSGALGAVALNTLVYFQDSAAAHPQTAAEGKVVGGRYMGTVTGISPFDHIIEVGYVPSGSTV